MPYDPINNTWKDTELMVKLKAEKKAANDLQVRRHEDWDENYTLYRGKVKTNRLTQRQPVNIPLMKETIKTQLAHIDEAPSIDWQELSGDEQKELIYQEIWEDTYRQDKLELIDIIDKKSVLLYGIGTKKLNIKKDGILISPLDTYDVVFDPLMTVGDIESSRFVIHQNIFKSVRDILADDRYTKQGKEDLKLWADSPPGITHGSDNQEKFEDKMERLKAMGVNHSDFPLYAGGDRLINLTEHFTTIWNGKSWERRVVVYADNQIELMNKSLDELLGVDFWPFVTWAEDPESVDQYADSIADLIRVPNKVLNIWFSQLLENRTLKNFQMSYLNVENGNQPQTYQPGPGTQIPIKGNPRENIMPVEISGLDDTLNAINAITQIAERASASTAIEKGVAEKGQQTLGEIQILTGKAQERTVAMAKFYRMAWYETAWKWDKLMHANAPRMLKLNKTGRSGKSYPKRVFLNDWKSTAGYRPVVSSSSEQEAESVKGIQKFTFVLQQFPNNVALKKVAQKRMLEILDVTPEELRQIEEGENQPVQTAQPTPVQGTRLPQVAPEITQLQTV